LPENTILWFQDHDWCKERLVDFEEDLDLFLQRKDSGAEKITERSEDRLERKNVTPDDFISVKEFEEKILLRHIVEFSYQPSDVDHHYEIEFNTKPQPAFHRQFDLLIKDLKSWE